METKVPENYEVTLHEATLDKKKIAYSSESIFLVQIGKGKGSYKTKYTVKGNLAKAVMLFNGINIGNGYKKRLFAPYFNNKTLARKLS